MQRTIKREIQKSSQPDFHSDIRYYSDLELSKTSDANLETISNSRVSLLSTDDVDKDLKHFSKKAMKNIWD